MCGSWWRSQVRRDPWDGEPGAASRGRTGNLGRELVGVTGDPSRWRGSMEEGKGGKLRDGGIGSPNGLREGKASVSRVIEQGFLPAGLRRPGSGWWWRWHR